MPDTNVSDFIGELGGGVVEQKIAHILSDVAFAVVNHGGGNKKGKVGIELTLSQVGDNQQVMVTAKLSQSAPTKRGKIAMEDSTDTPFFVGRGGVMSTIQPKEEESGQATAVFNLKSQRDGM